MNIISMLLNANGGSTIFLLTIAIQVLLPLLVGLVTKKSHSARLKACLLVVLTLVAQFLTGWLTAEQNHGSVNLVTIAANVVFGFIVSIASHFGFLKPVGATDAAQAAGVKDTPALPGGPQAA